MCKVSIISRIVSAKYSFTSLSSFLYNRKMATFCGAEIKGVLLDITGVLYESGQREAISGSIDAIKRLQCAGLPFRLVTNETQRTRSSLVEKLNSFGYSLREGDVVSPGLATAAYLKERNLRPFLLVHPDILPEFEGCASPGNGDCVVVGDAAEHFSYENVNRAFSVLMKSQEPLLISMGKGKYYKEKDDLVMDLGGYTAALEYAADVKATIIGKPSPDYFMSALKDLQVEPHEAVMVGDDINSDVHAAQKCGIKGVLVKTGKFRNSDLRHPLVKPDAIVNNLAHFVDILCHTS